MRKDVIHLFPTLESYIHDDVVFLDSAASSFMCRPAFEAYQKFTLKFSCNIHRGVYQRSIEATQLYEMARDSIAEYLSVSDSRQIIFTSGTTMGLNFVSRALAQMVSSDRNEVILTDAEHHANVVPWKILEQQGFFKIRYCSLNEDGRVNEEELFRLLSDKTCCVSLIHASNVLGVYNPIRDITARVKKLFPECLVCVDGAQAIPHEPVNIRDLGCDFYVFSGHKIFAPTGIGVLYGRLDLLEEFSPIFGGGDMILSVTRDNVIFKEPPAKFEAGTPPIAAAIAMSEALRFLNEEGYDMVASVEKSIVENAYQRLVEHPKVSFPLQNFKPDVPVFSFNIDSVHPHDVGSIFDENKVAIRVGHHCAQPLMEALGQTAVARASFSIYNDMSDVERLLLAINEVCKVFEI